MKDRPIATHFAQAILFAFAMLSIAPATAAAQPVEPLTVYDANGWEVHLSNGYCMADRQIEEQAKLAISVVDNDKILLFAYGIDQTWDEYDGFGMVSFHRKSLPDVGPITLVGRTEISQTNTGQLRAVYHLKTEYNVRFLDAILVSDILTITAGPAVVSTIDLGKKEEALDALFACYMNLPKTR